MQLAHCTLDEGQILNELDRIVATIAPEELQTWNLDGHETFRDFIAAEVDKEFGQVPHAPHLMPEMMEALKWTSLVLGCVKSVLEIAKLMKHPSPDKAEQKTPTKESIKMTVKKHLHSLKVPNDINAKIVQSLAESIHSSMRWDKL